MEKFLLQGRDGRDTALAGMDHGVEAQAACLGQAEVMGGHGPHLAVEVHLAPEDAFFRQRNVLLG